MRELFKAKDTKGIWREGLLFRKLKKVSALEFITIGKEIKSELWIQTLAIECDVDVLQEYKIDPGTICQFICEIDGQKFWEHDIVSHEVGDISQENGYYEVVNKRLEYSVLIWDQHSFKIQGEEEQCSIWDWNTMKYAGNKFDNPELLNQNERNTI